MRDTGDTIAAIATPLGAGGIGVVRLSGPDAVPIAQRVFVRPNGAPLRQPQSHRMYYGFVLDSAGERVDEGLCCVMRQPRSYTREDVAELQCHGGVLTTQRVLEAVLAQGARVAEPGEFTRRAFVNGRLDLTQVEAVIDVINARTLASHRAALQQLEGTLSQRLRALREELLHVSVALEVGIDFPDEDIDFVPVPALRASLLALADQLTRLLATFAQGRTLREGLAIAIVGRPNVGKSSLLNALLGRDRAMVSPHPGTTRDTIEEALHIAGFLVRMIDTAGIRVSSDTLEQEGMRRARAAAQQADLLLVLLDASVPLTADDVLVLTETAQTPRLLVRTKSDLPASWFPEALADYTAHEPCLDVSAVQGEGLETLERLLVHRALGHEPFAQDEILLTRARHYQNLSTACTNVHTAAQGLQQNMPLELVAFEVTEALQQIAEVLGEHCSDEILDRIFSSFCIGK